MSGGAGEGQATTGGGKVPSWLIIVLAVIGGGGLLLCGGVATLMGSSALTLGQDRKEIEHTLDDFVRAMSRHDTDRAYSLMSTRAQRVVPRSQLEAAVEGDAFVMWHNYISLDVTNIRTKHQAHTNPDVPQGKVADVAGVVRYHGNHTGQLRATLEREEGAWRVHGVNIVVPPNKIRDLDLARQSGERQHAGGSPGWRATEGSDRQ